MSVAGQWIWLPWYYRRIWHNVDMNSRTGTLEGSDFYTVLPKLKKQEFSRQRNESVADK
jgi:hypothetical protein